MRRSWLLTCGAGVLGTLASAGWAAATQPAEEIENPLLWKPQTKSVAVFKNGFGFFMREGGVSLREGWCTAGQVPPAAFGTLAIYSHQEDEVVDVVGSGPGEVVEFNDRDAPRSPETRRDRLKACMDMRVSLSYKQKGDERTAEGKVVSIGPDFVVLDNKEHSFAVPIDGISRMQVLELPVRIHVSKGVGGVPAKSTLGMAYLRAGITWIPDYTLRVIDDENAELTLRGTIVNEAEDLIHCDVHFVVGVPNFLHAEFLAPIAIGGAIRTIGAAVGPIQLRSQIASNTLTFSNAAQDTNDVFNQALVQSQTPDTGGDAIRAMMGSLPQMGGAAATDFTVYTKKDLTVRRGEQAIVTLFVKRIKYSHVYRWQTSERIRHLLSLHNGTDTAWTTGPCLAISAERPLTEDLLRYTPTGGRVEIPVTAAINIAHDRSETEIDRKLKDHSPGKDKYLDRVTLEGTLKIRNYDKRTADIHVEAPVAGKPVSASEGGTITIDTSKLKLVEREGVIRWHIQLEPGQSSTLTYQYERYVPSE